MLKIINSYGGTDSTVKLDQTGLTGDVTVDRNSDYVRSLVGGRVVTLDASGSVQLAEDTDFVEGFIVNDASGYEFENIPALASGIVTILTGGGVVITDQVVESNVVVGDKLYAKGGMLSKVPTDASTAIVFGYARTANSASDKSLTVRFV